VAERAVTEGDLNRALLSRQLLLERSRLPLARAIERMGGIQNQYAPNAYIRLATCVEGFRRDDLTRALERGTVVQGTLMRSTIHLVSAREYWHYAAGIRQALREWQLRVDRETERAMRRRAERLQAALAEGPKTAKDLGPLLRGHTSLWVELLRLPPTGTWERRRADLYALAERVVGPCTVTEEEGRDHLVRAYLRGFGPARLEDVASWAGVPARLLAPSLDRVRLRRLPGDLLDVPRAPLPPAGTPAAVRLLPTWDAVLLVHARRTGVLPEELRPVVFSTKNPPSVATFLVDGRVAGAWRLEGSGVRLEPYGQLARASRAALLAEGERLAAALA
jgi:winged helix DNA-binding protein